MTAPKNKISKYATDKRKHERDTLQTANRKKHD